MSGTKHWTFETPDMADTFDHHVRTQLPWYDLVTRYVAGLVENYLPTGGTLYDVGASTGNVTKSCEELISERNALVTSIEQSAEMCKKWAGVGSLVRADASQFDYEDFDVAVVFLTAMFMTVSQRSGFFAKLRDARKLGGIIILVDKFCDLEGYEGTVLRRLTMKEKLNCGQSAKDIIDKDLSLAGVQRPMTEDEIGEATQFFQMGEFRGYLLK